MNKDELTAPSYTLEHGTTISFTDPDAFFETLAPDLTTRSSIIGRGTYRVEMKYIDLDNLRLSWFAEQLPRLAHSALMPGFHAIQFLTHAGQPSYVCGLEARVGDLVMLKAGAEAHSRIGAGQRSARILVAHDELAETAEALLGREVKALSFTHRFTPAAPLMSWLMGLHERTLEQIKPTHPEVTRAVRGAIMHALISCIDAAPVEHGRHSYAAIMRRFEQYIEANSDRPLYVMDLCKAVGVSDRTLRTCCCEYLGMGPKRYLWLRRMYQARQALRSADPRTATVTDVAMNYGFGELGRFAVTYRALFGESPSTTLRGFWTHAEGIVNLTDHSPV